MTVRTRLRGVALDLTPLRASPPFRRLLFGDAVSVIGTQVTTVAVPIQVYAQTRSAAAVGLVGLAGLVPLIVFGLYGGAIADAVDRRKLVLFSVTGQLLLACVLVAQAAADLGSTGLLYAVVAAQAALFAIEHPARQALIPRLLPTSLLPAANALRQVEFNLGVTVGPLLAGVLVARYGYEAAYGLDALTFTAALVAVLGLPSVPPEGGGRRAGFASVLEGLAFLRTRQVLLMTFVLDLVAMVFAMPRALFPAMAEQVYGGGPQTTGLLYSALAVGALLGALFSGWLGRVHRHGVAVVLAICAWGVSVTLFGVTDVLWLGLVFLAAAGLADMVSAVFRTAILQAAAPDEMRGRLGAVRAPGLVGARRADRRRRHRRHRRGRQALPGVRRARPVGLSPLSRPSRPAPALPGPRG